MENNVVLGPQHFELLKLIGEGGFGSVYLVKNRLSLAIPSHPISTTTIASTTPISNDIYAMKVISKRLLRKKNHISYMRAERDILTKINHPFIVSLKFAFQTETKLYLVMDYLQGGELFFHLKRRGLILEKEAQFYLGEMVLAVEFLHSVGIIHRDLKPENILLSSNGNISITDFGFAKEIGSNDEGNRTLCGTSEYMAPEMLVRNGYGKSVDWWSLGALCFEMLTGNPPFRAKTTKELDRKIIQEKLVTPSFLSASAHSLLRGMLEKDVNKRLGCSKSTMFAIGGVAALKQHVFFEGLNWDKLYHMELTPPIEIDTNEGVDNNYAINFHEGFTSRCLSPSILEDNILTSPPSKSAAVSDGEEEDFSDFNYSIPFACTSEQLQEFEKILSIKVSKATKRQSLKLKKNEERMEKLLLEEEANRIQEEERKRLALVQAAEEKERDERDAVLKEKLRMERLLADDLRKRESYEIALAEHALSIEKVQKKSKNLRKKLRDIIELEAKATSGGVISAEQIQKLARKQIIEDEIAECDCEEDDLNAKPPLVPEYVVLCNDTLVSRLQVGEQLSTHRNVTDRSLEDGHDKLIKSGFDSLQLSSAEESASVNEKRSENGRKKIEEDNWKYVASTKNKDKKR